MTDPDPVILNLAGVICDAIAGHKGDGWDVAVARAAYAAVLDDLREPSEAMIEAGDNATIRLVERVLGLPERPEAKKLMNDVWPLFKNVTKDDPTNTSAEIFAAVVEARRREVLGE